jgi:phosphatidylglycerophosphatase A
MTPVPPPRVRLVDDLGLFGWDELVALFFLASGAAGLLIGMTLADWLGLG